MNMVGINPSDIVDGKTSVVLGLIWRMVLNFQVQFWIAFEFRAFIDENKVFAAIESGLLDTYCFIQIEEVLEQLKKYEDIGVETKNKKKSADSGNFFRAGNWWIKFFFRVF